MSGYQTEQKRKLLAFLEQNAEAAYSIDEIIRGLSEAHPNETLPGKSTLYRLMTRLVDEGAVKRFVKGNSRHFVYQLLRGKDCVGHLHLRCSSCGHQPHHLSELCRAGAFVRQPQSRSHRYIPDLLTQRDQPDHHGSSGPCPEPRRLQSHRCRIKISIFRKSAERISPICPDPFSAGWRCLTL